jgi:hypothetical protein
MKSLASYSRASISLVVAIAVVAAFTLNSFAAPEINKPVAKPNPLQDCTGTLTVKSGQVNINGNAAQTGATMLSGSTVTTNSNGEAIIDLGAIGQVELGENTTATITCVGGLLEIRTNCSRTEVEVRRGAVDIKAPKIETLAVGQKNKETYGDSVQLTSMGGVYIKIECEGRKAAGLWFGPGLLGLLALIGVGAGVAIGVGLGDGDIVPPTSPIR